MKFERDPLRRGREPTMDLPPGRTCGDCVHCARCTAMFGHMPADETCDWSPSRFRLDAGKLEYASWFPLQARFPAHCPWCGSPTSVAEEAYCANADCRWNNGGTAPPGFTPRTMLSDGQLRKAMHRAFTLGQTYWQQADSHSTADHRRSDETQAKFDALVNETAAALAPGVPAVAPEQWRPMETAPTDGTIVRLLVDYRGEDACHPLEDAEVTHTIGGNTDGHTGLSEGWKFAGWSWEQDCFTEGRGKPIGWLPFAPPGPKDGGDA